MDKNKLLSLLDAFGMCVPVSEWGPFGHGHINDTWLIRTPGEIPDFIIQRKNHLKEPLRTKLRQSYLAGRSDLRVFQGINSGSMRARHFSGALEKERSSSAKENRPHFSIS